MPAVTTVALDSAVRESREHLNGDPQRRLWAFAPVDITKPPPAFQKLPSMHHSIT